MFNDKSALLKIAHVLINKSKYLNPLTDSEIEILDILRDKRIVRKNIVPEGYSLTHDPSHKSPTWG